MASVMVVVVVSTDSVDGEWRWWWWLSTDGVDGVRGGCLLMVVRVIVVVAVSSDGKYCGRGGCSI